MKMCLDVRKHFTEIVDLSKEREFWLDLSDYDVVKVLRYLIEFTRSDLPNREIIMEYLSGFMNDFSSDDFDEHFSRWCV